MRPLQLTDEKLIAALARGTFFSAADLAAQLEVSQPTISRGLSRLAGRVVRLGAARFSRYALPRDVRRLGDRWPLHRIDPQGRPTTLGWLHALNGGPWYFESEPPRPALIHGGFEGGIYPDLPWFLEDLRPQGFLGRAFMQAHAEALDVPLDLPAWTSDHVLAALLRYGDILPGDLVLGDESLDLALRESIRPQALSPEGREEAYPRQAAAALRGQAVGSSAGGEQPKFTVTLQAPGGDHRAAIVKFSEPRDTASAVRWADLLQCEHLAGVVMNEAGLRAAPTQVLDAAGRRFLESSRFDRTPVLGRRGHVSLRALDAAHFGRARAPWPDMADLLLEQGWIDPPTASDLTVAGLFGDLIANTDMHFGNVAFVLTDERPLALVPFFDMLPMLYAPGSAGAIVERAFEPRPPRPRQMPHWRIAAQMASEFWQRVARDAAISSDFGAVAAANGRVVDALGARFG